MTTEVYLRPKETEVVRALDDSHLPAYLESVKSSYNSGLARATLGVDNKRVSSVNGEFAGSSSFINSFLLDKEGLYPNKTRPITRHKLEEAIVEDKEFLSWLYGDLGIGIWPKPETYNFNKHSYESLVEQFKKRNIPLETGKLIYFSGLAKPREDSKSAYGLVLDLRDIDTKELKDSIVDLSQFNWNWKKGNGLARAFRLHRYWVCDGENLADSDSAGRVVGWACLKI